MSYVFFQENLLSLVHDRFAFFNYLSFKKNFVNKAEAAVGILRHKKIISKNLNLTLAAGLVAGGLNLSCSVPAHADSINDAMILAYENNATLKARRAGLRAANEGVPIARSGFLPNISGSASYGRGKVESMPSVKTGTIGITISQKLFDGFKTVNNVKAVDAQVRAARYTLLNTEQNILFNTTSSYADVLRDAKLITIRRKNLSFLQEQLRAARSRLNVGEGTKTEVAQAEAQLAAAQAQYSLAQTNYENSKAVYRQIVGTEAKKLSSAVRLQVSLPNSLNQAISMAFNEHPALLASEELVNVARYEIESAKSDLYPTLSIVGSAEKNYIDGGAATGSLMAQLSIPIFQGGRVAAQVRQSKEQFREKELEVDVTRNEIRAAVVSAWTTMQNAKASIRANRAQIKASRLALNGVIEERKVGQKTTLDVLTAQNTLLNAQDALIGSERNAIVSKFGLLSAVGKLTARHLNLNVSYHDPQVHYTAVKDKWFGLRTVDSQ